MFKINCDQQDIPCTVIDAYIAECKFPPKPGETNSRGELVTCYYDVVLQLQDASGNTDYWYGEISSRSGMGNNTHLYRLDLTLKTLQDIDFNVRTLTELEQQFVAGADRSVTIPNLIGKTCNAVVVKTVRQDGREFCNVRYLNGGPSIKKMSFDDFMARKNMSTTTPNTTAAPVPPAAPGYPAANPLPQGGIAAPGYPAAPPAPGAAQTPGRAANPYEAR